MSAVLHRIEALPGEGRHAVTFRLADGTDQTAIVHLVGERVDVAEASLPPGVTRDSPLFAAVTAALSAFAGARRATAAMPALHDVPGGWDVSLGNVVLAASGRARCTAHGEMTADDDGVLVCGECGARARFD